MSHGESWECQGIAQSGKGGGGGRGTESCCAPILWGRGNVMIMVQPCWHLFRCWLSSLGLTVTWRRYGAVSCMLMVLYASILCYMYYIIDKSIYWWTGMTSLLQWFVLSKSDAISCLWAWEEKSLWFWSGYISRCTSFVSHCHSLMLKSWKVLSPH